jgi:predicted dehydrogenase
MQTVRLGVVGLGNMGRTHRHNIIGGKVARLEVTAICDRPEALDPIPPREGEARFTEVSDMIRSAKIDAILICTPHYFHTTMGIEALAAGLHVLVEKPISVHKADARRLLDAHTDKGRIFAAMFNIRTDPHYRTLKQLISSGETGPVRRVLWDTTNWFRTEYYYASGGWRATWKGEGGGVLLNQCPHNLDVFQWLFGMPDQITGFCQFGRYHQIEVEDDVTLYCRWKDGKHATIIASTGEAPGRNRLEVACERGHITVETGRISWTRTRQPIREFSESVEAAFAQPDYWNVEIPITGIGGGHIEILQNFVNAILDGEPLIAPAHEGIHSVEIANAALLSTWLGRTIDLPMDAGLYEKLLTEKADSSTFQKKQIKKRIATPEDFAKSFQR